MQCNQDRGYTCERLQALVYSIMCNIWYIISIQNIIQNIQDIRHNV